MHQLQMGSFVASAVASQFQTTIAAAFVAHTSLQPGLLLQFRKDLVRIQLVWLPQAITVATQAGFHRMD
jgi:hypothetical protein